MNRKLFFDGLVLVTISLLSATSLSAQEMKIGFVNLPRLLSESPQANHIRQQLQDEFAPRERQILAQQQTLQNLKDQIDRDGALMGDAEKRNLERDYNQGGRDLKRKQEEFLEDFNLRQNEELSNLQRTLMDEVQTYASSGGYDLIVGEPGILYVSEGIDITTEVLAAMEKAFQASNGGQ